MPTWSLSTQLLWKSDLPHRFSIEEGRTKRMSNWPILVVFEVIAFVQNRLNWVLATSAHLCKICQASLIVLHVSFFHVCTKADVRRVAAHLPYWHTNSETYDPKSIASWFCAGAMSSSVLRCDLLYISWRWSFHLRQVHRCMYCSYISQSCFQLFQCLLIFAFDVTAGR